MGEWPLLIFTISVQAAIGGTFMLLLFKARNKQKNDLEIFNLFKIPLIIIAVLSLIGLAGSFSHLGAPLNALNTIRNIGSSWMSREIVVTGAFIGLAVLTAAWALYFKKVPTWLLFGASIIGFIDVYCMAAIYAHSLIGPWNSIHTFLSFYGATFVLGAILAVALLTPRLYKKDMTQEAKQFLKIALIFAMLGFGLHVIGIALFTPDPLVITQVGGSAGAAVMASYKVMFAFRWIVSLLGLGLFGYLALSAYKKSYVAFTIITLLVFVFSEGMDRYIFYALGS